MLRRCNNAARYQARRWRTLVLDVRDWSGRTGGIDWGNLTMMMVMMMGIVLVMMP